MAVPPAVGARPGLTGTGRNRRLILAILTVALVLLLAVGAWLVATRHAEVPGTDWRLGGQTGEQAERDEVLSLTTTFLQRVNNYGPDGVQGDRMPEYRERVVELLSPKFAEEFQNTVAAAEATVAQAGMSRSSEVTGTGVSVLDSDSATVLAAGSFTNSYPDQQGGRVDTTPLPFRFEVSLVKVEGEWLVDGFQPVLGPEAPDQGQPGGQPTEQPGEESTP